MLYVRGTHTYEANLNPESGLGTIASIVSILQRLDRFAEGEQEKYERKEQALVDYMGQLNRPFEHEEHLRELCVKQQEMNRQLDLDKSETQVVAEARKEDEIIDSSVERLPARRAARVAAQYVGTAAM